MESKKQLAFAICEFLQDSMKDINDDSKEGLEVAIQSIEEAFGIDLTNKELSIKPNDLQKIFNVFVQTKQAAKQPTATPAPKDTEKAEELKKEGNKFLAAKDFESAIQKYTEAIEIDDTNAVFFANRAAAYSQAGKHDLAAQDAKQALFVNPEYSKAYSRLGHAEFCLGNYQEAIDAYKKGLDKEPANANLKQSLAAAEAKLSETSPAARSAPSGGMSGGMPDFASLMSDPNLMNMAQSMMSNPAMADMMKNPALANMMGGAGNGGMPDIASLMSNPAIASMAQNLMKDPSALQSLMQNPAIAEMAKKYTK